MILFHAKRDGTVTTTPSFVPQSSALADLVVVSEFDYALCTIRLMPATGEYIPDIVCNFVIAANTEATIWTAPLPPEATKLHGSVEYQLIFTAADGTQQGTLTGSFSVPKGAITNTPENVGDLEKKSIYDLYTLLANIFGVYKALDAELDEEIKRVDKDMEEGFSAADKKIDNLSDLVMTGGPLASSVGTVVIPASEWAESDENPVEARIKIPDIKENSVAFLIPADDDTRKAATDAALTVMLETLDEDADTVFVARGDSTPSEDMTFLCFVMKGKAAVAEGEEAAVSFPPSVSFVGISTGSGGGGGGGGGGSDYVSFRVFNRTGWLAKTITLGATCKVTVSWSSTEDKMATGDGMAEIVVNGTRKATRGIPQGLVELDLTKYLIQGNNLVEITITDVYDNSRTIKYTVNAVSLGLSSYFSDETPFTGEIPYSYVPVGELAKTMHFLVDGKEIGTEEVTASNREQSYTVPAQEHGSHSFEVYFTGEIDGEDVESNHLYYDLICVEEGVTTPIIGCSFRTDAVVQHTTVVIPYVVYTPGALTSAVQLKDGAAIVANLEVDGTRQTWSYKASVAGAKSLSIVCGDTVKTITFSVTESDVTIEAESQNLQLYLTAQGRSNNEASPLTWTYGGVSATMTGFNLKSDGWQNDEDGNTVLRVAGDARVEIPFHIFGTSFGSTGKTIEIELATRNVANYDATVFSCWSGERGVQVTAQKATLKSELSEIFTQYKEDEHIRVAFTVEKEAENRLLAIYINGIMSGVVQYPVGDDFSQLEPVGITIGSNDCTTDIYCIRVYGNNLTRYQILDNWIADTQDADTMMERYRRNEIFDAYGNIDITRLPSELPYMVVNAASYDDLPQYKGDKKIVGGMYLDPLHPERCFTFEGAEINVQGTSSQFYSRKNYLLTFLQGLTVNGEHRDTYALREASMPTDRFCMKADVASSEGANNVELVRLYDDTCPVETPPQENDPRVRQGIEGYPCLMFYYDGTRYNFLGKYNFNNDKSTEEVFGFAHGDESWEILLNNTLMAVWKDDNFVGSAWEATFEGRYPDKNLDVTNLKAFATWLKSTDTTAEGLTAAEKTERLAKFKAEFADWANVDAMLFNYLFTEAFLMIDNRAKNAFPTRYGADGKWLILPYDYDSAIGINNSGELKFGYHLEDTDTIGGENVFNGQDSVLYVNMRLAFAEELKTMYQDLRRGGVFSYEEIERRFEEHQGVWGEAIYNEDARFKYIEPLVQDGDESYLPMLQGSKAEQRKWWLYNRFRYLDSKYEAGDSLTDYVRLRTYGVADLTLTPYADIYAAAKFDSVVVKERALRGTSTTLENPLEAANDTVVAVYSASQLSDMGDLSPFKLGATDFSKAIRLNRLKLGSGATGYTNPNLNKLTIGNLTLLTELDIRGCTALTEAVDLSGCASIERVYAERTAITGVKLPVGGILKTLHLPATVSSLEIVNHNQLTDLTLAGTANLTTLRLEGTNNTGLNVPAVLMGMPANSRVRLLDVDWVMDSVEDIYALYDKLDTFRGLDDKGHGTNRAVIRGRIHVDIVTSKDLTTLSSRYPNITIDYVQIVHAIKFIVEGEIISHQRLASGEAITKPNNPTKESTAQYQYTFGGWSLDGESVADVPKFAESSDLTFTALFTETVRTYTVRFLQGTTVLQTVTVAYGSDAVFTGTPPVSAGKEFSGWEPAPTNITGDTDCYAQFDVALQVAEITDDWDTILAAVSDGTYRQKYKVGNYKALTLGTETVNMQIAAFDADVLADGSGTAPITWLSKEALATSMRFNPEVVSVKGDVETGAWIVPNPDNSPNEWRSQNQKVNSKARAKWTITADTQCELTIQYKTSAAYATYNKLTVSVDAVEIATNIASSTWKSHLVSLEAGDVVSVEAMFTILSGEHYGLVKFDYTGNCAIEVETDTITVSKHLYYQEGTGAFGGWEKSELRAYLNDTLEPLIPEIVRNSIQTVKKNTIGSSIYGEIEEIESQDRVWIPSVREVFGRTNYENEGAYYSILLGDSASRIKTKKDSATAIKWRSRSGRSGSMLTGVDVNGTLDTMQYGYITYAVVIGFCT